MTRTLAELYVKQGLIGKAREIYRRLAEQGDEAARQRLAELPSSKGGIEALQQLLERVRKNSTVLRQHWASVCPKITETFFWHSMVEK